MVKLGLKGRQWLKGFHLFFVSLWVGSGVTLVLMLRFLKASEGGQLHGLDTAMKFVDDFIIIPGAFGCLLTGLLFALFTNWGFFKHRWIIVKWIVNVGGIIFGSFWLGPWLNSLPVISGRLGLAALNDPVYVHSQIMLSWWGPVQLLTLIAAVFISTIKPWKKKGGPGKVRGEE